MKKDQGKKQASTGLRGKQAVEAVIFHLRLALYHQGNENTPPGLTQQHLAKADELFGALPADRKAVVNMVRNYLQPFNPKQPITEFVDYVPATRSLGAKAKFVSVPLSADELATFKRLAGQSEFGNMANYAATLIREEMKKRLAA